MRPRIPNLSPKCQVEGFARLCENAVNGTGSDEIAFLMIQASTLTTRRFPGHPLCTLKSYDPYFSFRTLAS